MALDNLELVLLGKKVVHVWLQLGVSIQDAVSDTFGTKKMLMQSSGGGGGGAGAHFWPQ